MEILTGKRVFIFYFETTGLPIMKNINKKENTMIIKIILVMTLLESFQLVGTMMIILIHKKLIMIILKNILLNL